MKRYQLYIDGSFVDSVSGKTFESVNPFNQEVIAVVARAGAEDVRNAVKAARKAFDEGPWPRMSREERSALLKAVSDKINEKTKDLVALEVADSGSTIRKAKEDIYLSAGWMNYFPKLATRKMTEPIEGWGKPKNSSSPERTNK